MLIAIWDNTTKAVNYRHRAGHQAVERSAYAEAVSHLTTAIDLLTTLPETRERSQQELVVQMTLGSVRIAPRGGGAPEVERLYIRARELCEQVGEQLLSPAQRLQDPDLLLEAHHLWQQGKRTPKGG